MLNSSFPSCNVDVQATLLLDRLGLGLERERVRVRVRVWVRIRVWVRVRVRARLRVRVRRCTFFNMFCSSIILPCLIAMLDASLLFLT